MNQSPIDYIVVGAGSSGAIVAERISANGRHHVLLLESGPTNRHPFVVMPKGNAKLLSDPNRTWAYETDAYDDVPAEAWPRGRMLGGSSAINGMMYFRGQAQDYEDWQALGADGWGWEEMRRVFAEMEDHSLGAGGGRGVGGPLPITVLERGDELSEAFIRAGEAMGVPRVADLNNPEQEGVGYTPSTTSGGKRMSSARAFLDKARKRANLRIETGVEVDRVLFDGTRAVGVAGRVNGQYREFRTEGEVILCAGALNSPAILQRSGIGDAPHLTSLGIAPIADRKEVGEHLLEHRAYMMDYELNCPIDENREYRGLRLIGNVLAYFLASSGAMARAPYSATGFFRTQPGLDRPDVQVIMAPFVRVLREGKLAVDSRPSMQVFCYPCRSRSRGYVRIRSSDPRDNPAIRPNYLTDPYDREVTVRGFRFVRDWMRQPAIARHVSKERGPIAQMDHDDDIVALFRTHGRSTFHSCGTCRMGSHPDAVLDSRLRVNGTSRLRVVDASIMPAMPSCNTNGPAMAIGWRGAEIILQDRND